MTETTAIAIAIADHCACYLGTFRVINNRIYDGYDVGKAARDEAIAAIDAERAHVLRTYPTSHIAEVTEEVEDMLAELAQAREDVYYLFERNVDRYFFE